MPEVMYMPQHTRRARCACTTQAASRHVTYSSRRPDNALIGTLKVTPSRSFLFVGHVVYLEFACGTCNRLYKGARQHVSINR